MKRTKTQGYHIMVETKKAKKQYDEAAKKYMDMLKFHADTQKAVCLYHVLTEMNNLDAMLAELGEQ